MFALLLLLLLFVVVAADVVMLPAAGFGVTAARSFVVDVPVVASAAAARKDGPAVVHGA